MKVDEPSDFGELLPQHRRQLVESGIDPAVARARGYRSITESSELSKLGFAPQQAALVPGLLIPIHGVCGDIALHQFRPDKPRKNRKNGKPVKYETPRGCRMVLDVPPAIREKLANPSIPLYATEGPKKADAGASRGICVIGFLGVWNWRGTNEDGGKTALADWELISLKDRKVFIVFDSDVTTKPAVAKALRRLKAFLAMRGANVTVLLLPHGPTGEKQGLDDFLAGGGTVEQLNACAAQQWLVDAEGERASVAQLCVNLVQEHFELGVDTEKNAFVLDKQQPGVVFPIHGRAKEFRARLSAQMRKRHGRVPNAAALTDAITTLEGMALDCVPRRVDVRVAQFDGDIYLDLGRADAQVVRITPSGWSVGRESRVLFRRTPLTGELPIPVRGGDLDALRELINFDLEIWNLVKAWLLYGFVPEAPHPVLIVRGQQGTGKSFAAEALLSLFDPSSAIKRTQPANPRQWAISAAGSWAILIDNVSEIPAWWSDALCKAVTGDAWVDRSLYTDGDITVLQFRRVLALTSIDLGSLRGDLADRSLIADLTPIEPNHRRTESELRTALRELNPSLLGAALTLLTEILAELPSASTPELPRMADFARFLAAMDQAELKRRTRRTRRTAILDQFLRHLDQSSLMVVEDDSIGNAILDFMSDRDEWKGTATDLLNDLKSRCLSTDPPKSPSSFSGRLNRLIAPLRSTGILVMTERSPGRDRKRLITIRREPENAVRRVRGVRTESDSTIEPDYDGRGLVEARPDTTACRPTPAEVGRLSNDVGRDMGSVGRASDAPNSNAVRAQPNFEPSTKESPDCSCRQASRWRRKGRSSTTCLACHPPPDPTDPDIEYVKNGVLIPRSFDAGSGGTS